MSSSFASFAPAGAPSAFAKLSIERLTEPGERRAVVDELHSRLTLIEMLSEYAGTTGVVELWTSGCYSSLTMPLLMSLADH